MNFYCNSGGTIFHVDPERIFQGSAGVNTIRFIGRFPSSAQVLLAYKLPNGNLTSPKVLTLVDELAEVEAPDNGGKFSVWETVLGAVPRLDSNGRVLKDDNGNVVYDLDFTITENYGTATLQFFVYAASNSITVNGQVYNVKGGLLATASSNFTIEKGAPALIPTVEELTPTDAQVLLAEILNIISSNQTAYNNFTQEVTGKITAIEGSVNTALEEVAQVVENDKVQDEEIAEIRELVENAEQVAKGVQLAVSYADYSAMITALNALSSNSYDVGQSIYIATLNVPDLWVYAIEATAVPYTYTSDEDFINSLLANGFVQVGNYKLAALETGKVAIGDYVLLSEFSDEMGERFLKGEGAPTTATVAPFVGALYLDTTNNNTYQCTAIDKATPSYTWVKLIRETDYATEGKAGVIIGSTTFGYGISTNGALLANPLSLSEYKNKTWSSFISKGTLESIKYDYVMRALSEYQVAAGETSTWTDDDKTKACETIGAVKKPETSVSYDRVVFFPGRQLNPGYLYMTDLVANGTVVKRNDKSEILAATPTEESSVNALTTREYVDNLPDKLTLTDEQKAKWQAFIGLKSEMWTFTLADGSTVEKQVIVSDLNTVSGTWLLNETITEIPAQETVNFTSNSGAYTSMDKGTQEGLIELYYIFENGTRIGVYTSATGWRNSAYRTIAFDGTQAVSAEFYAWLTANAVKQ